MTRVWKQISFAEALSQIPDRPAEGALRSVQLFKHGTLQVEMYAPRGIDPQKPHPRDEVYVVASGSGTFLCDGQRERLRAGDFLFVPAGMDHRFEGFTDDLVVWVFFYGPQGGEKPRI
jgi:mannose-6-phosphate isomerase-like protein (cupin superfamily)